MPLPYRWLTALMLRYNGKSILIDCGEGTQIALREKGWSPKPVDIICFTHYHADHISGLPGMLLTMGNAERTEPLLLIGPKGLNRTVNALRTIAPELPFEINCMEISEAEQEFFFEGFRIKAFKVNHSVVCYGYSMIVDRAGRFDRERALEKQIPMKFWSRLQRGGHHRGGRTHLHAGYGAWSGPERTEGYLLHRYPSYRLHYGECAGFGSPDSGGDVRGAGKADQGKGKQTYDNV